MGDYTSCMHGVHVRPVPILRLWLQKMITMVMHDKLYTPAAMMNIARFFKHRSLNAHVLCELCMFAHIT